MWRYERQDWHFFYWWQSSRRRLLCGSQCWWETCWSRCFKMMKIPQPYSLLEQIIMGCIISCWATQNGPYSTAFWLVVSFLSVRLDCLQVSHTANAKRISPLWSRRHCPGACSQWQEGKVSFQEAYCSERRQAINQITEYVGVLASGKCITMKSCQVGGRGATWPSKVWWNLHRLESIWEKTRRESEAGRHRWMNLLSEQGAGILEEVDTWRVFEGQWREASHVSGAEKGEDLLSAIFCLGKSTISFYVLGWAPSIPHWHTLVPQTVPVLRKAGTRCQRASVSLWTLVSQLWVRVYAPQSGEGSEKQWE